ncbi:small ubiquitin-related modifier 2-A-like [Mastomys coucha]|uniref:small ubiquitin-related modifier 2-A-like n=1 Tax=Mastomys coucha TaxID=35658 RepID=UPI0012617C84|nr:small ubiquitin-related modifier 2-A-like [Mastomys coucha]
MAIGSWETSPEGVASGNVILVDSGSHFQLKETANEKPTEGVKTENNDHNRLKITRKGGSVVQFKIKRQASLSKPMKACCIAQLEMEGEAMADVFQQQTGCVF